MIEKYLNEIREHKEIDYENGCEEKVTYTFCGDGQGDFETSSSDTTLECLGDYKTHLLNQLAICEKLITKKQGD